MMKLKRFGKKLIRNIYSLAPKYKLIPPPTQWENKISVIMTNKNECDWIEPSLLSLKGFADEILIGDQDSTDGSIEIIKRIKHHNNSMNIQLFEFGDETFLNILSFLYEKAKYRWILLTAGDIIANTSGKSNIKYLKQRILNLDDTFYYGIILSHVYLTLDLFHTPKDQPFNTEVYLTSKSKDLCAFKETQRGMIHTFVPLYYKILQYRDPFMFHINVKPNIRNLFRKYWSYWLSKGESEMTLEEYVKREIRKDYHTSSFKEASILRLQEMTLNIKPFDVKPFGDYPELIKPFVRNPRYKLIYNHFGNVSDRMEPKRKDNL